MIEQENMNYEKIGNFIKEQRNIKGITQKELAKRIGLTDKAISKWERALGCPDVSVLELLAKELDCSVLEILKGRKITNEVIQITEADDYIKETLELGENKNKKFINKILEISIIFIVVLLAYLNIVQIINIDKEYEIDYGIGTKRTYTKLSEEIDNNLEIIRNHKGKFSEEDHKEIVKMLDDINKGIKSAKIYQYIINQEIIKYNVNDEILLCKMPEISSNQLINILEKYSDEKIITYYKDRVIVNPFSTNASLSYKYRLSFFTDYGDWWFDSYGKDIYNSYLTMRSILLETKYMTGLIMEVGDIHE